MMSTTNRNITLGSLGDWLFDLFFCVTSNLFSYSMSFFESLDGDIIVSDGPYHEAGENDA